MTARNTVGITCPTEPPKCSHENTKKVKKFGKKCALCHTRVWRFWKVRKCLGCKTVFHKSCIAVLEKETTQKSTAEATTALETTAENVIPAATPRAIAAMPSVQRVAGDGVAPMYVTPTPWLLANITAVTIDCRRRPISLTMLLSQGHELAVSMFHGLLEMLPVSPPTSVWKVHLTNAEPTRRSIEWYTGVTEAGDSS